MDSKWLSDIPRTNRTSCCLGSPGRWRFIGIMTYEIVLRLQLLNSNVVRQPKGSFPSSDGTLRPDNNFEATATDKGTTVFEEGQNFEGCISEYRPLEEAEDCLSGLREWLCVSTASSSSTEDYASIWCCVRVVSWSRTRVVLFVDHRCKYLS